MAGKQVVPHKADVVPAGHVRVLMIETRAVNNKVLRLHQTATVTEAEAEYLVVRGYAKQV